MPVRPTACPECGSVRVEVVLTRPTRDYLHILRRRHCKGCHYRWYTLQGAERHLDDSDLRWLGTHRRDHGLADFEIHARALVN